MTARKPSSDRQKIDRSYRRLIAMDARFKALEATQRLNHESDQATIKMLTGVNRSLENDNKILRRYLGKILFERGQFTSANQFMGEPR